jgi:hypothetical protein
MGGAEIPRRSLLIHGVVMYRQSSCRTSPTPTVRFRRAGGLAADSLGSHDPFHQQGTQELGRARCARFLRSANERELKLTAFQSTRRGRLTSRDKSSGFRLNRAVEPAFAQSFDARRKMGMRMFATGTNATAGQGPSTSACSIRKGSSAASSSRRPTATPSSVNRARPNRPCLGIGRAR